MQNEKKKEGKERKEKKSSKQSNQKIAGKNRLLLPLVKLQFPLLAKWEGFLYYYIISH